MSHFLLILQIVVVVLVVVVGLLFEVLRPTPRPGPATGEEALEDITPAVLPWYWAVRVETGVMEVALAMSATAMALPAFAQPGSSVPPFVVWGFQITLLLSGSLSSLATLWLYQIYIRQMGMLGESGPLPPYNRGSGPANNPFSALKSGPYALLAYAIILLLIGLGMLPVIVVL
jgi:hypothetical protein